MTHELFTEEIAGELVAGPIRGFRAFRDMPSAPGPTSTNWLYTWEPGWITADCQQLAQRRSAGTLRCPCGCGGTVQVLGGLAQLSGFRSPLPDHEAPAAADICGCGFYGWYDSADWRLVDSDLLAVIEAAGRLRLGTHGFRAERARVVALALERPNGDMKAPGWFDERWLGVKVVETREELRTLYPPTSTGLTKHVCGERCHRLRAEAELMAMARGYERDPSEVKFAALKTAALEFSSRCATEVVIEHKDGIRYVIALGRVQHVQPPPGPGYIEWGQANPAVRRQASPSDLMRAMDKAMQEAARQMAEAFQKSAQATARAQAAVDAQPLPPFAAAIEAKKIRATGPDRPKRWWFR